MLDVLRPYVRLTMDPIPKTVKRGHGKRRVPPSVVGVLRQESNDLMVQRASRSLEPFLPFARAKLEIAVGEVPENLLRRAVELAGKGNRHEAISLLRHGTSLYPESAPLHAFLADQLIQEELWDQALTVGQQAVTSQPAIILGHLTLGIALAHEGNHAQALAHLRIVDLASRPFHLPEADLRRMHLAIGACLYGLGDYHYASERVQAAARPTGAPESTSWLQTRGDLVESTARGMRAASHKPDLHKFTVAQVLGRWTSEEPYVYEEPDPCILPEGIALGGSSEWIDYDLECDFQLVNGAAGFLIRADAWGTTGLMMQLTPTMLRGHQFRHGDYFAQPETNVPLPGRLAWDKWHRVRFKASGNTVTTWVDDAFVNEWTDFMTIYRSGKVGFRLWGREFTLYRNLRVTVSKSWVRARH